MSFNVYICSFDSTGDLPKRATYEQIKKRVLEAGRYSVFEACDRPYIFMRLDKDPDVEVTRLWFPWFSVKRKETKKEK